MKYIKAKNKKNSRPIVKRLRDESYTHTPAVPPKLTNTICSTCFLNAENGTGYYYFTTADSKASSINCVTDFHRPSALSKHSFMYYSFSQSYTIVFYCNRWLPKVQEFIERYIRHLILPLAQSFLLPLH